MVDERRTYALKDNGITIDSVPQFVNVSIPIVTLAGVQQFLLELGTGFAFVGREYRLVDAMTKEV